MPYTVSKLAVLAYAQGFTHFVYRAHQIPLSEVLQDRYFDNAYDIFSQGDVLLITAKDGAAHRWISKTDGGEVKLQPLV